MSKPDDAWEEGDLVFPDDPLINEAAHRPFKADPLFGGTFSEQRNEQED